MQAAETGGMAPRPDGEGMSSPVVPHGRRAETLQSGRQKECMAHYEALPARNEPMTYHKQAVRYPLTRVIFALAVAAGMIASIAFPTFAQDGTSAVPENAHTKSYGGGWDCDLGYRVEGAECVVLDIPENAYATGRSHGTGWACHRGYEEVGGISCNPIPVPANAFLRSSGHDWQCDRGYRKARDTCVPVVLPEHAYLTEETSGSGWACDRGYTEDAGICLSIDVPENAYLTNSSYGAPWACERGFVEIDGRCDTLVIPANAFLDPGSYGPGWRCERGYEPRGGACVVIDLPDNAHLDRSGNRWRCDPSFRLSGGACVLGR